MRRLLTVFILMTYMASAIGFSFSFHYCAGHYKGVCFTSDTEKDCCGDNEHETNCCNDKVVKAKFKDDHSHSVKIIASKILIVDALPGYKPTLIRNVSVDRYVAPYVATDSSPPFERHVPIYVRNCVFRV